MKERPILFSAPMVRAILEGRKTQTRRVVKPVGNDGGFVLLDQGDGWWPYRSDDGDSPMHTVKRGGKLYQDETPHTCPYGQPGDRLWGRETWCCVHGIPAADGKPHPDDFVRYQADAGPGEQVISDVKAWHPSIHMPRVYSRILLEITAVRVERLQDISEADAKAEGADCLIWNGIEGTAADLIDWPLKEVGNPYRNGYALLWESINGPGSWAANSWVWVVDFQKVAP